jgi:hypothetical protein
MEPPFHTWRPLDLTKKRGLGIELTEAIPRSRGGHLHGGIVVATLSPGPGVFRRYHWRRRSHSRSSRSNSHTQPGSGHQPSGSRPNRPCRPRTARRTRWSRLHGGGRRLASSNSLLALRPAARRPARAARRARPPSAGSSLQVAGRSYAEDRTGQGRFPHHRAAVVQQLDTIMRPTVRRAAGTSTPGADLTDPPDATVGLGGHLRQRRDGEVGKLASLALEIAPQPFSRFATVQGSLAKRV